MQFPKRGEIRIQDVNVEREPESADIFDPEKEISLDDWRQIIIALNTIFHRLRADGAHGAPFRTECATLIALIRPHIFEELPAVIREASLFDKDAIEHELRINFSNKIRLIKSIEKGNDPSEKEMLEDKYLSLLEFGFTSKVLFPQTSFEVPKKMQRKIQKKILKIAGGSWWEYTPNDTETLPRLAAAVRIYGDENQEEIKNELETVAEAMLDEAKEAHDDNNEYICTAGWLRVISPDLFKAKIKCDTEVFKKMIEDTKTRIQKIKTFTSEAYFEAYYEGENILKTILALTILSAEKVWVDETGLHYTMPSAPPHVSKIPPIPPHLNF